MMFALSFELSSLEYAKQFENDQITIVRVKISPHEEIGLHRDNYPSVITVLQGGTITRLEADGRTTDITLPTGATVVRKADPENEFHKTVNNTSEPVELMIVQLKNNTAITNANDHLHEVAIEIKIDCPLSPELKDFAKSIPPAGSQSASFEDWKNSFVNNMTKLIHLVQSEKISHSFWSAKTDDHLMQVIQKD